MDVLIRLVVILSSHCVYVYDVYMYVCIHSWHAYIQSPHCIPKIPVIFLCQLDFNTFWGKIQLYGEFYLILICCLFRYNSATEKHKKAQINDHDSGISAPGLCLNVLHSARWGFCWLQFPDVDLGIPTDLKSVLVSTPECHVALCLPSILKLVFGSFLIKLSSKYSFYLGMGTHRS